MQHKTREWLNARGIIDKVLLNHDISWNDYAIQIPILDANGELSHTKYRKNPFSKSSRPKYWNDNGSNAQLYNRHNAHLHKHVVIVEGEMDVLRLESAGIYAVSSTGGAGTFKQEWADLFANHKVVICYDLDDAGLTGMQKTATMFPRGCLLTVLPEELEEHGDVTDYLNAGYKLSSLRGGKFSYLTDNAINEVNKKEKTKYYKRILENVKEMQRTFNIGRKNPIELHYLYNFFNDKLKRLKVTKRQKLDEDEVVRARSYPLTELYEGDLQHKGNKATGLCNIHNEKSPSFVIYTEQNSWYCYGACSKGGDSIAFIMERDGLSFNEAVKKLNE